MMVPVGDRRDLQNGPFLKHRTVDVVGTPRPNRTRRTSAPANESRARSRLSPWKLSQRFSQLTLIASPGRLQQTQARTLRVQRYEICGFDVQARRQREQGRQRGRSLAGFDLGQVRLCEVRLPRHASWVSLASWRRKRMRAPRARASRAGSFAGMRRLMISGRAM